MIAITVNGERRELSRRMKLIRFLRVNGISPRMVAVAVNGEVLHRHDWPDVTLRDGDVLEIVRMVGGGALEMGGWG